MISKGRFCTNIELLERNALAKLERRSHDNICASNFQFGPEPMEASRIRKVAKNS
jgi:hypothetical protein